MKPLLFLIIISLGVTCLVSPISAVDYTITSAPLYAHHSVFFSSSTNIDLDVLATDERISRIYFDTPMNSQIDFTLYYGPNTTVAGQIETHRTGLLNERVQTTLTLGGVTSTYNFINVNPSYEVDVSGYGKVSNTNTTGFLLYSYAYGTMDNTNAAFYPVSSLSSNTIYRIKITSNVPFNSEMVVGSNADVSGSVGKTVLDQLQEYIDLGFAIGSIVKDVILDVLYWLKFLFIDNLVLTVSLYFSVTMAYAALTARSIFKFFGKFFSDQIKLLNFVIDMWQKVVWLINSFVNIFK